MRKKACVVSVILCMFVATWFSGCETNGKETSGTPTYEGYEYSKFIKVDDYKKIKVKKKKIKVNDKEVSDEIERRLNQGTREVKTKKGTVKDGDLVNLDYEGKIDGQTFTANLDGSIEYHIGKDKEIIEGIDKALIGSNIGASKTFKVKVPAKTLEQKDDGKERMADYKVTANFIRENQTPVYHDNWVKKNSDFKNKKQFEKALKKELRDNKVKQMLWEKTLGAARVTKVPDEKAKLFPFDLTYESYWKQKGDKEDHVSEDSAKKTLLLFYIAEKENLNYTQVEYEQAKTAMLNTGLSQGNFELAFTSDMGNYIHQNLLYEKVRDFLYHNAVKGKPQNKLEKESEEEESKQSEQEETNSSPTSQGTTTTNEGQTKAPTKPKQTSPPKKDPNKDKDKGGKGDDATSNTEPGGADF